LSKALTWSGGPRARYVTSGLESPYFSITQEQSIASRAAWPDQVARRR